MASATAWTSLWRTSLFLFDADLSRIKSWFHPLPITFVPPLLSSDGTYITAPCWARTDPLRARWAASSRWCTVELWFASLEASMSSSGWRFLFSPVCIFDDLPCTLKSRLSKCLNSASEPSDANLIPPLTNVSHSSFWSIGNCTAKKMSHGFDNANCGIVLTSWEIARACSSLHSSFEALLSPSPSDENVLPRINPAICFSDISAAGVVKVADFSKAVKALFNLFL